MSGRTCCGQCAGERRLGHNRAKSHAWLEEDRRLLPLEMRFRRFRENWEKTREAYR